MNGTSLATRKSVVVEEAIVEDGVLVPVVVVVCKDQPLPEKLRSSKNFKKPAIFYQRHGFGE